MLMKDNQGNTLVASDFFAQKLIKVVDHEETGRRIRKLREGKNLSLRKVARKLDVSAPYLSDLERGNRNWTIVLVMKIMSTINILSKTTGDSANDINKDYS